MEFVLDRRNFGPLHIVVLALLWQVRETDVSLAYFLSIGVLSSAISWFAFLLAMFHFAKLSGRENRYLSFAIANNWTSLFIAALSIPVEIAELTHLLEGDVLAFAMAVSFLYRFALPWFVARHALNLSGLAAIGVVMLDILITGAVAIVSYPMIFGTGTV